MDNLGICRFHRGWAEEMLPEIVESLYGLKDALPARRSRSPPAASTAATPRVYWESEADIQFVRTFMARIRDTGGEADPALDSWIAAFDSNPSEAALDFWFEVRKGIDESLREFL
ncbi:MAG: hypothetical protein M0C28_26275 [Candidatus Moduliflexus flocculans]|nr:hypothetical protein [Candidatus Moduliflexus flocculans]